MSNLNKLLGGLSGGDILDVGTGDGSFIHLLTNHLKDFHTATGIDTSADVIQSVRQNYHDNAVRFEVMSGDEMGFPSESFNLVAISNSLHHLDRLDRTLKEMYRVLKPGGLFVINEVVSDGLNEKQQMHLQLHHFQADIDMILGSTHNKCYQKQEVTELAGSIGLKDVNMLVYENEMFNKYVQIDKFLEWYRIILEKIKGYPQYEYYSRKFSEIAAAVQRTGIEFQLQLMIAGRK